MVDQDKQWHWHALSAEEVLKQGNASKDGLSQEQAQRRLGEAGPNTLEAEEGVSPWRLVARQVHNPLIYLLLAAALVSTDKGRAETCECLREGLLQG